MKKRIALALCALLCLTPVLAAGSEEKFPTVNTYPGYADVRESDWFYDNARLCYEIGIMTGTDVGFEPGKILTEAECVTLAARVGSTLRGEPIRDKMDGEDWWVPYNAYVFPDGGSIDFPDRAAGRWQFLILLYDYVDGAGLLTPINSISKLPDTDLPDEAVALKYYNAGILTGVDKYGTLETWKSLTRAEAAAMISRIVRPELRKTFVPADYTPFTAAHLTPDTVMFEGGTTAERFLEQVNLHIENQEAAALRDGVEFNWHRQDLNGKTALQNVKDDTLSALGVTAAMGTQAYQDFDYQVYYARLIDLTGKTLAPDHTPAANAGERSAESPSPSGGASSQNPSGSGGSSAPEKPSLPVGGGTSSAETVLSVNGQAVALEPFQALLNSIIYSKDYDLSLQGTRLDWNADYGVGDLELYFLNEALNEALRQALYSAEAQSLGVPVDRLPAALFPDPGDGALGEFAQQTDYLCAKHILVSAPETAAAVLDGLKAVPTLGQFEALLYIYGEDSGMKDGNNPQGYLFTSGTMIPEFEAGVRSLEIGSYTAEPVRSTLGYHIIWRLDPADHPDLLLIYQNYMTDLRIRLLAQQSQITLNEGLLDSLDVAGGYTAFLNALPR